MLSKYDVVFDPQPKGRDFACLAGWLLAGPKIFRLSIFSTLIQKTLNFSTLNQTLKFSNPEPKC